MWMKLWETVDGKDSGRWQWFQDEEYPKPDKEVAVRAAITGGKKGWAYPGVWLPADAICPPPGVGGCITGNEKRRKNQARMSIR